MHETVSRVRRLVRDERVQEGVSEAVSRHLQGAGLSRALSEPLAAQVDLLYREAFAWLRLSDAIKQGGAETGARMHELLYVSRRIRMLLDDLMPFLERAEDTLSEREEITHRESAYERDVVPFSRLESTQGFRAFLTERPEFGFELASVGAQLEADLLKVVYLESVLVETAPKPPDLYAMTMELLLDARRHLAPGFEEGSSFMNAMGRAAQAG
jgi:hypothetical protein